MTSKILAHKNIGILKPTHGHQPGKDGVIRPSDELIDRSQQFKHITKSLIAYFDGLADIQTSTAKSTEALTHQIQVPFHEGHHFLGDGGWQATLYEVRDKTKFLSEQHHTFARTIREGVVRQLEGVRSEIKAHITAIEKEAGVIADEVDKERTLSAQHLTTLQQGIDTFENSSSHMLPQHDPYVTHTQVLNQLKKQVHRENDLQSALIRFQGQQGEYEYGLVRSIQSACRLYDEAYEVQTKAIAKYQQEIAAALQRVPADAEYKHYLASENGLLDPNAPLRSIEAITFPGHNHASSSPIKEGMLERKRRFTKAYKESYYVLTPSGYLHERRSNDDTNAIKPTFSLFLPECSLGPPSKPSDKSHKFHVEGNKAVRSSFEGKWKKSIRFGGKEIAYTLRARTHQEMLGWWEEMDKLSRDTQKPPRGGAAAGTSPVAAAIINVGLPDDDKRRVTPAEAPAKIKASEAKVAVENAGVTTTGTNEQSSAFTEQVGDDEDEDEEGGSSAEEEEAAAAGSSTAPVTVVPATSGDGVATTEALPGYASNGVAAPAEKSALEEKAELAKKDAEAAEAAKASGSSSGLLGGLLGKK